MFIAVFLFQIVRFSKTEFRIKSKPTLTFEVEVAVGGVGKESVVVSINICTVIESSTSAWISNPLGNYLWDCQTSIKQDLLRKSPHYHPKFIAKSKTRNLTAAKLRILASYKADRAKISTLWTFWPIIQLIDQ